MMTPRGTGGKSAGRTPKETPDTLRSKSIARMVDLLSEGEIEGLVNEDGDLLSDAQLVNEPTVVNGAIQDNLGVLPGSSGYRGTSIALNIFDSKGKGASGYAVITNGVVTSVKITDGGSGYVKPTITIPPVTGQAIYLDEVPLQNGDNSYNFEDVFVSYRDGSVSQNPLDSFDDTQIILHGNSLDFTDKLPRDLSFGGVDVDALYIGVSVPQGLQVIDPKTGDINGSSVDFTVSIIFSGGAEQLLYSDRIQGKASSAYVRTRLVDIRRFKPTDSYTPFRLIFRRQTPNGENSYTTNSTAVDFVTGIIYSRLSYPHSALIGMEVNAQTFSRVPNRAYRVRLLRVRVPDNYFPETRQYNRDPVTGLPVEDANGNPVDQPWTGGFYIAWTDNPAWCFFDLATSERYGTGIEMPDGVINKWWLYRIARYCDELVPDGFGGMEPRFTCFLYLQTREDAFKVLSDIVSIFRGMLYWDVGMVHVVQDAPTVVREIFANANVKDGNFTYSGTSRKARHSVALVRWNDPEDFYRAKTEYVEDKDALLTMGYRELDIVAFGCVSRGQAHRLGNWALFSEREETETVSFRTGLEGTLLRPGQVFAVADNNRSGVQYGGRVFSIALNRTSLTTDRPVSLSGEILNPPPDNDPEFVKVPYTTPIAVDPADVSFSIVNDVVSYQVSTSKTYYYKIEFGYYRPGIPNRNGTPSPPFLVWETIALDVEGTGDVLLGQYTPRSGYALYGPPTVRAWITAYKQSADPTQYDQTFPESFLAYLVTPQASLPAEEITEAGQVSETAPAQITPFRVTGTSSSPEGFLVLNFSEALPESVVKGSIWGLSTSRVVPQEFRCLSIEEVGPNEYEITGLEHHAAKYQAVENEVKFEDRPISVLPDAMYIPRAPQNVRVRVVRVTTGLGQVFKVSLWWDAPTGSYVSGYEIEMKKGLGNYEYAATVPVPQVDIEVTVPDSYSFRIYSLGISNRKSAPASISVVVGDIVTPDGEVTDYPEKITGLELAGKGNSVLYEGRDPVFDWRINSATNSYEIGSEPNGGNSGGNSDDFAYYEVLIQSPDGELLRRVSSPVSNYTFTFEENRQSPKGPHRDFIISVRAKDLTNNTSAGQAIRVNNPHPAKPTISVNTSDLAANQRVVFNFPLPSATDFAGFRLWLKKNSAPDPKVDRPVFEGPALSVPIKLDANSEYYYCVAEYDTFSIWEEYANFSPEALTAAISTVQQITVP